MVVVMMVVVVVVCVVREGVGWHGIPSMPPSSPSSGISSSTSRLLLLLMRLLLGPRRFISPRRRSAESGVLPAWGVAREWGCEGRGQQGDAGGEGVFGVNEDTAQVGNGKGESRDSAGVGGPSCWRDRLSWRRRRWSLRSSSLLSTLVAELAMDHTESLCCRRPRRDTPDSDTTSPTSDAPSPLSSSFSSMAGCGEGPAPVPPSSSSSFMSWPSRSKSNESWPMMRRFRGTSGERCPWSWYPGSIRPRDIH
ncbi:hypothetical protein E2C01_002432 [Portunus trituberculatus]|uniref:Secreted protein n=1 Tax=Portunus trituberculatus TaxID=210409 RepID=A0A5B7CKK0_PORTR|nr:hypothetical protein [Portunus trituberculatus]